MWIAERNGCKLMQERVTDPLTGKSRIVSCTIQKDTPAGRKAARQKLEAKLLRKKPASLKKMKLSDLIRKYEESMQQDVDHGDLREQTMIRNIYSMKAVLKTLDDVYVDQLTAGYVLQCLDESGRNNTSKNELLRRLKAFLRWAYKRDLIKSRDVIDKIGKYPELSEREKIKDKYLEASEVKKLITGMTCRRWALLTEFLVLSGLRIGEAIALDTSDIDARNIHVTKTFNSITHAIGPTKTDGSTRDVHIQPELARCIKEIKIEMLKERMIYGYGSTPYFMTGPDGERLSYYAYKYYLKKSGKDILGREGVTPHITRHTHTSLLAAAGVPFDTISRRLGHSSPQITRNIYMHITKTLKVNDAKAVDNVSMFKVC